MHATRLEHDEALILCEKIHDALPGVAADIKNEVAIGTLEHRADSILVALNRICLSHTARIRGPNPNTVFALAHTLLAEASQNPGSKPPAHTVLEQTAETARVKTSSGKLYGLTKKNGLWYRGYTFGPDIPTAMLGAD